MDSSNLDPASVIPVDRASLQQAVIKLLQRKGMFAAEAEIVAERMIEADLLHRFDEGTGTLPEYLEALDLGDIDPRARVLTVSESAATMVLDGSTGMGHVATTRAMLAAVEKAGAVGTATVVVRNSRPCGDLGGIARLAAKQGLIGLVVSSFDEAPDAAETSHNMAWAIPAAEGASPAIQRVRRTGTSPLAILGELLSAGLAGADAPPRKRKLLREANPAEYNLTAINPESFGSRGSLSSKWQFLWTADATATADAASATVPLRVADAQRLAELAARIKLPVNW